MSKFFLVLTTLISGLAFAAEIPLSKERQLNGYPESPIVKCPAIPESISSVMNQLGTIKASIKKDANCQHLENNVSSLETLLNTDRKKFQELLDKSKQTTLDEKELTTIREYVENSMNKVAQLSELMERNNYCFEEDRSLADFNQLSSIALEATTLINNLAGSWATPITMTGNVLAGIFQGIQKLIQSHRGYDFTNPEHIESYVRNLCTYYNYRGEVDSLLLPERYLQELKALRQELTLHMENISLACPECNTFVAMSSTAANDLVNDLKAMSKQLDAAFELPLGTFTLKTLDTLAWLNEEIQKVEDSLKSHAPGYDMGRDLLFDMSLDLDRFLFEREAPRFIEQQALDAWQLFQEFEQFVRNNCEPLINDVVRAIHQPSEYARRRSSSQVVDFLIKNEPMVRAKNARLADRMVTEFSKSLRLFDHAVLATNAAVDYCNFFQRVQFYTEETQHSCEGYYLRHAIETARKVKINGHSYNLIRAVDAELDYSKNWIESLTNRIRLINQYPERYRVKR